MKVNKLSIRYIIEKYRARKDSKSILICRLTYFNKRKQFSTGLSIYPANWNSKQQLVEPPEPDSEYINTQLSLIRQNLNQAFLFLQVKGTPFTVLDIYKEYKGETPKDEVGVMEAYRLHSARIKKLIGIEIKEVTHQKYLESGVHLQSFISWKFKSKDIHLKALRSSFLGQYEYFLKTEKNLTNLRRFQRVRDQNLGRLVPTHDVDLLAAQLIDDVSDATTPNTDTRADRVDLAVDRRHGHLRSVTRLAGQRPDLDDPLAHLGHLQLEQLTDVVRMGLGQDDANLALLFANV